MFSERFVSFLQGSRYMLSNVYEGLLPEEALLLYLHADRPFLDLGPHLDQMHVIKESKFVKVINRKLPLYHYKEKVYSGRHMSPIVSVGPGTSTFKKSLNVPVKYSVHVTGAKGICARQFIRSISEEDKLKIGYSIDWDYLCRRVEEEKETILTEGYSWINT